MKPLAETWVDFISTDPSCRPIAAYRIRSQRAVSVISYDRKYYESFNGKVRITIDENLVSFDQRTSSKPNLRFGRQHLNQIVIEAKVDASDANCLPIVFDQLPFSPKRFSKYCESLIPQKHI
ncbi:MAG: VTC domain-containing protein [Opitutae bacterium]|nr:VTC domain-containing protein [Opitutae bacterium]